MSKKWPVRNNWKNLSPGERDTVKIWLFVITFAALMILIGVSQ